MMKAGGWLIWALWLVLTATSALGCPARHSSTGAAVEKPLTGAPVRRTTGYSYDPAGNRTGKTVDGVAVQSCEWDHRNRQAGVTTQGLGTAQYGYDYRMRRVQERVRGRFLTGVG